MALGRKIVILTRSGATRRILLSKLTAQHLTDAEAAVHFLATTYQNIQHGADDARIREELERSGWALNPMSKWGKEPEHQRRSREDAAAFEKQLKNRRNEEAKQAKKILNQAQDLTGRMRKTLAAQKKRSRA